MTQRRWIAALLLGLTVTLLAGCSTTRVVEGQVQSFSASGRARTCHVPH